MSSGSFKDVIYKMCLGVTYLIYIYKEDLALNNLQCLLSYLPTPPLEQDMTQGQFLKRSLTGLISEFSFS